IGLEGLRRVCAATSLPVIAIGGITRERVAEVLAAGAAGVAVMSAVAAAVDMEVAVRSLAGALGAGERSRQGAKPPRGKAARENEKPETGNPKSET
ncbi:MAG: thiamine phosphate synthase, partial [Armatimonadetes bacterium]|nr:thiamine phosphate synthase [Armatimonadota bacterium]